MYEEESAKTNSELRMLTQLYATGRVTYYTNLGVIPDVQEAMGGDGCCAVWCPLVPNCMADDAASGDSRANYSGKLPEWFPCPLTEVPVNLHFSPSTQVGLHYMHPTTHTFSWSGSRTSQLPTHLSNSPLVTWNAFPAMAAAPEDPGSCSLDAASTMEWQTLRP